jgi:hypothetical protein
MPMVSAYYRENRWSGSPLGFRETAGSLEVCFLDTSTLCYSNSFKNSRSL